MKNGLLVLLAMITIPSALAAQSTSTAISTAPKSTKGDFALLFDLGGLAQLALDGFYGPGGDTSELGAGFGAKYFVADDIGVRLGITMRSLSTDVPVGPDSTEFSDKLTSFRFAITPSVVVNVVKSGPVAGYIGGQVSFGSTSSSNTPADTNERPRIDASMTAIGVGAIIGAEWFPWSNISLSGEYILAFARSSSEREEQRGSANATRFELPTETSIGVHSRGVLTAAMYW